MRRPRAHLARLLLLTCVAATLASTVAPRAANADDRDDASGLFRAAQAAYERGEFRAAALAFEQAYLRLPNVVAKYNEGLSWQDAGDLPRAADALARVVDNPSLPPGPREDARRRLGALAPRLFVLTVQASPPGARVSIAHVSAAPAPLVVHLLPGNHVLHVRADGLPESERHVVATTGGAMGVSVVLAAPPSLPPAHRSPQPWLTVGLVGLGLGAALTVTGAVLGNDYLDARDRYLPARTDRDLYDQAHRDQTWADISFLGAAVLGAAGITVVTTSLLGARTRASVAGTGFVLSGEL